MSGDHLLEHVADKGEGFGLVRLDGAGEFGVFGEVLVLLLEEDVFKVAQALLERDDLNAELLGFAQEPLELGRSEDGAGVVGSVEPFVGENGFVFDEDGIDALIFEVFEKGGEVRGLEHDPLEVQMNCDQ